MKNKSIRERESREKRKKKYFAKLYERTILMLKSLINYFSIGSRLKILRCSSNIEIKIMNFYYLILNSYIALKARENLQVNYSRYRFASAPCCFSIASCHFCISRFLFLH